MDGANTWRLQYMQKRTKIVEIVAAQGLIFALAQSGACAAFSRGGQGTAFDPRAVPVWMRDGCSSLLRNRCWLNENWTALPAAALELLTEVEARVPRG